MKPLIENLIGTNGTRIARGFLVPPCMNVHGAIPQMPLVEAHCTPDGSSTHLLIELLTFIFRSQERLMSTEVSHGPKAWATCSQCFKSVVLKILNVDTRYCSFLVQFARVEAPLLLNTTHRA